MDSGRTMVYLLSKSAPVKTDWFQKAVHLYVSVWENDPTCRLGDSEKSALRRRFAVRHISWTNSRKISAESACLFSPVVNWRPRLSPPTHTHCRWYIVSVLCLHWWYICGHINPNVSVRAVMLCVITEALLWSCRGMLLSFRQNISC